MPSTEEFLATVYARILSEPEIAAAVYSLIGPRTDPSVKPLMTQEAAVTKLRIMFADAGVVLTDEEVLSSLEEQFGGQAWN